MIHHSVPFYFFSFLQKSCDVCEENLDQPKSCLRNIKVYWAIFGTRILCVHFDTQYMHTSQELCTSSKKPLPLRAQQFLLWLHVHADRCWVIMLSGWSSKETAERILLFWTKLTFLWFTQFTCKFWQNLKKKSFMHNVHTIRVKSRRALLQVRSVTTLAIYFQFGQSKGIRAKVEGKDTKWEVMRNNWKLDCHFVTCPVHQQQKRSDNLVTTLFLVLLQSSRAAV